MLIKKEKRHEAKEKQAPLRAEVSSQQTDSEPYFMAICNLGQESSGSQQTLP
jgi:hypothetical protein